LIARRSSTVRASGVFQSAMSACMEISVGIQWLLQPERYFPGPTVFERKKLIDVRPAVDHCLVINPHPGCSARDFSKAGDIGIFAWRRRGQNQFHGNFYNNLAPIKHGISLLARLAGGVIDYACFTVADSSETALSLPSMRFSVDFSTWVALRERK
jgi:hypothetical protein